MDSQPASHRVQASIPTKPTMLHYWGTIALPRGLNSVSEGMRIWAASLWSHRGQSSPPAGLSFVYSPGTEQLIPSSATCGESPQSCRICSALPSCLWQGSTPERREAVEEHSVCDAYLCVCVYVSKHINVCSFQSGRLKIQIWQCSVLKERRAGSGLLKQFFWGQRAFWGF